MTPLIRCATVLALVFAIGACGDAKAESCYEYAGQIDDLIAAGDNDALSSFIEDSEEHVARLINDDPDRAQPCADAVLEAVFVVGFADLEDLFEE